MAPTTDKPKKGGKGAARARGTNVGPADQASSFFSSSEAASQGLAPAIPNFQTPTFASQARSGAFAPPQDVVAPPQDVTMEAQDIEMGDMPPQKDPSEEVDVEMGNADENTVPQSPAPVVRLPPAVPVPVVRLPPAVPVPVVALPPAVPAPVAEPQPAVPAPAEQTMQVQSLLASLPSPLSREEQTKLKMANIRARIEAIKKRQLESTDDSADNRPSAAKKQHTEEPAVQEPALVRRPFPYKEVLKCKRTFCCIRLGGGPIIGSLQRQNGYGIKFSMDPGAQGVHAFMLEIVCNVADKSIPSEDINPAPRDIDIILMAWYTGARAVPDSDEGPYQLEDFEIFCAQDHPGHVAANDRSIMEACPEGKRKRLTYCRFKSNQNYFPNQVAGGSAWEGLDSGVTRSLRSLMEGAGYYVELWFLHSFPDSSSFEREVLSYFRQAYEARLPTLSQYDVLDLGGTPSIMEIGQGVYCRYPLKSVTRSKYKVEDQSDGPIGFHTLPTLNIFNFRRDFEIYHALIPIRESQYQKGLAVNVEMNTVRVYLMSLTGIEVKDRTQFQQMTREQQRFHKTFYAFIRMPGQNCQKQLAPTPGLRVQIEWDNSDPQRQKAHAPVKSSYRWKGIVIPHQGATTTATGTDYCVLLTMPEPIDRMPFRPFREPKYLSNRQLPLAHLKVNYSNVTYQRELEAWLAFCNSGKLQIMAMQKVLRSNAYLNETDVERFDMSSGPHQSVEDRQRYRELVDRFERDNTLDQSQIQALRRAALAPKGTRMIQGPTGTGKTWTAVHLTWALINAGHTVLFVAPTNVAVDNATTTLMRSRPADMAHDKVIRLEATNLSMGEITKYIDYNEMERLDQPGIVKPLPDPEDDPVLQDLVDEFEASLDVQADVDFDKFEAEKMSFEKAYELTLNAYKTRLQDYPVEASLNFNVWRTCKEDFDRSATRMRNAQLMTAHNITELITSEETESSEYSKAVQNYIHFEGKMSSAARMAFLKLRVQQEARNISKASVICTTSSNAGADILAAKFDPTVIILDEVGQMTAPAMAVPLMAFKNWIASYSFGDPQQLQPLIPSEKFCEVKGAAERSVLATYVDRNYPLLFLEIQHRMDPELALFPSQIFYDGKLRNAASTEIDNVYKQVIRRVTLKYYGIKGKDGNGSLYMMVDVVHGRARLEEGGTSLQNHANADAIVQAIGYLIDEGFPRSEIKLLTLYKGQKTILVSKLAEGIQGNHWVSEDVTTVDSYQGKQGVFACLDMVAASPIEEGKYPSTLTDDDADAAADAAGPAGFLNVHAATSFVTNPHRLCVGITRTTCGLFTFCQTATLVRAYKPSRSDYKNAVFKMVENAKQRGLLYRDMIHFDTHPTAVREVAALDAFHAQLQQRRQEDYQYDFVERIIRKAQSVRE